MRDPVGSVDEVARTGHQRLVADEESAVPGDHEPRLIVDGVDVSARRVPMARDVLLHDEQSAVRVIGRRLQDHEVAKGPEPTTLTGSEPKRPLRELAHRVVLQMLVSGPDWPPSWARARDHARRRQGHASTTNARLPGLSEVATVRVRVTVRVPRLSPSGGGRAFDN